VRPCLRWGSLILTDIPLPTLTEIVTCIIPEASTLLPGIPFTPASQVMLLAIGLQESRFQHRKQINGPARGFWQFEPGGGTRGVLYHPRTKRLAEDVASIRVDTTNIRPVNDALAQDDVLACAFARLLLWTDPSPLPKLWETESAWSCYLRNWRPGKPHRHTWDSLYHQAIETVIGRSS